MCFIFYSGGCWGVSSNSRIWTKSLLLGPARSPLYTFLYLSNFAPTDLKVSSLVHKGSPGIANRCQLWAIGRDLGDWVGEGGLCASGSFVSYFYLITCVCSTWKRMVWNVGVGTGKFGLLLTCSFPDKNNSCEGRCVVRVPALLLSLSPISAVPSTCGTFSANL